MNISSIISLMIILILVSGCAGKEEARQLVQAMQTTNKESAKVFSQYMQSAQETEVKKQQSIEPCYDWQVFSYLDVHVESAAANIVKNENCFLLLHVFFEHFLFQKWYLLHPQHQRFGKHNGCLGGNFQTAQDAHIVFVDAVQCILVEGQE